MMLASTAVAVTVAAHTRMNNCIDIVCRMTGRIEDNRLRTLEPLSTSGTADRCGKWHVSKQVASGTAQVAKF